MRFLGTALALLLLTGLVGCANTPPSRISLESKEFSASNAGLVVGRTLAHESDHWLGWKGLSLWFVNIDTNEVFKTVAGPSGYSSKQRFAIWLPEGRYELTAIFVHDGALGPAGKPIGFSVKAGEGIYIGTITHSWEGLTNLSVLGPLVTASKYGSIRCLYCNLGDRNPVVRTPYADVMVIDEGAKFIEDLKREYPNLPLNIQIRPNLLR